MKTFAAITVVALVAGCSLMDGTVDVDGNLTPAEVEAISRDLTTAVLIGTIANGAPILRDDNGKGSAICNALADPANSDTVLSVLATNGFCDVFTLATGQTSLPKPE